MCRELTVSLLIGCLIGSTWIPKSESNMLTPKTNLLTFWPKEVSWEISGIPFCVCSTSCVFSTCSCGHSKSSFSRVMGSPMAKARPTSLVLQGQWKEGRLFTRIGISKMRVLRNAQKRKRKKQHSGWPWEGVQNHVWLYGGIPGVYETEQNLCNPKYMKGRIAGKRFTSMAHYS